jgi:alpha-glucosidase
MPSRRRLRWRAGKPHETVPPPWDAGQFREMITENLAEARQQGASTAWVLSNHDVARHATVYGLPPDDHRTRQNGKARLLSRGTTPELDRGQ